MTTIDAKVLDMLEAWLAEAVPGPWHVATEHGMHGVSAGPDRVIGPTDSLRSAELIAALRNNAPALIALARKGLGVVHQGGRRGPEGDALTAPTVEALRTARDEARRSELERHTGKGDLERAQRADDASLRAVAELAVASAVLPRAGGAAERDMARDLAREMRQQRDLAEGALRVALAERDAARAAIALAKRGTERWAWWSRRAGAWRALAKRLRFERDGLLESLRVAAADRDRMRAALEGLQAMFAADWCHAEDCARTCHDDDAPCGEHPGGCPGCDCGAGAAQRFVAEALKGGEPDGRKPPATRRDAESALRAVLGCNTLDEAHAFAFTTIAALRRQVDDTAKVNAEATRRALAMADTQRKRADAAEAQIEEWRENSRRLEAARAAREDDAIREGDRADRAEAEAKRLREVLTWYANADYSAWPSNANRDGGERAREALKGGAPCP